ncbi:MAG TPA: VOC family protein [Anaerolineales bacterium]|nr:VOC family protein [Anaerolineales bacterium]
MAEQNYPYFAENRSMPAAVVIPELAYPDVREAVEWLCRSFGFSERLRIGNHRSQLSFGNGSIIVTRRAPPPDHEGGGKKESRDGQSHAMMVRVNDLEGHFERANREGAQILSPPADYPYGERQYSVQDPGGHLWTFSETIADIDPQTWGGELIA